MLRGDAVHDSGVPVVQDGGQVGEEDHRHAGGWAELSVGEGHAAGVDGLGGCVGPRRVHCSTLGRLDLDHRFISLTARRPLRCRSCYTKRIVIRTWTYVNPRYT